MNQSSKIRVLMLAEAANPDWTSVPLVGWSLARALMDVCDGLLVTQIRNREPILKAGLVEGRDVVCIDTEYIARRLMTLSVWMGARGGKGWTLGTAISTFAYYEFERLVWKRFGADIKAGKFDVVHRITPLTPTTPSLIARKCAKAGVPFVVGPLNGGVPWPKAFRSAQHQEREWLSHVRQLNRYLPGYRSMRKAAAALLIGSKDTLALEPAWVREKCVYLPENAISPERFNLKSSPGNSSDALKICFVGRLVPYKGVDMLLHAAKHLLEAGLVTVDVVGDGPMMEELRRDFSGIRGLEFRGWVLHAEVQRILGTADIFGFPSIREFGGGAVLEAMALGVMPLVVDYAGPGELVTAETGCKVPLLPRNELIAALREVLGKLSLPESRPEIRAKGRLAQQRVSEFFTWGAKAKQVERVYQCILAGGSLSSVNTVPMEK